MILVNTPGSWSYVYPPLLHAKWHGCTPTDLVFPFFLFIVGVSMWYSYKKLDHQLSKDAFLKLIKRAAMIFLIGMLLNYFPFFNKSLETLRIMGVLQRIAVAFLFGAIICLSIARKWLPLVGALILLGYWGIMASVGGPEPYSLENNLATTVDLAILGKAHLYGGFGIPFDPEGLLSSIPAIVTVMIGYYVGGNIDLTSSHAQKVRNLIIYGLIGIILGVLWNQLFPINKPLWTSSYVLYTAGIACIFLAILVWMIEWKEMKKWAQPFIIFGMNPLFIYALSGIFVKILIYIFKWENADGTTSTGYSWLYETIFVPIAGNLNGSLLFALSFVGILWLIAFFLWKKKIFIKV